MKKLYFTFYKFVVFLKLINYETFPNSFIPVKEFTTFKPSCQMLDNYIKIKNI